MTATLPASAAAKLRLLEIQHADAAALTRAAAGAVGNLRVTHQACLHKLKSAPTDAERAAVAVELGDIEQAIDRHEREVSLRMQREKVTGQVLARLKEFIITIPHGRVVEMVPAPLSDDPKSIELVRGEISALQRERAGFARAPMALDDVKAGIRETVEALAAIGRPYINTIGKLDISFERLQGDRIRRPEHVLAWLFPGQMVARLESELPATGGKHSATDRAKREREIVVGVLMLERTEEALIGAARDAGADVLRRPDCSPQAVLGVRIVKAAKLKAKAA